MDLDQPPIFRCSSCGEMKQKSEFSQSQLRRFSRGKPLRCKTCVAEQSSSPNKQRPSKREGHNKANRKISVALSAAPIKIIPRPQRPIPGFAGALTCCADWPKTKNGKPPPTQSSIFMPLLAMVVGPIEGYNTEKQLDFASQWWREALPAWPRWVLLLKESGVHKRRDELIQKAKGQPNSLIPRAKGYGLVPHFRGQMQTEMIESSPIVAVELYACVVYLYSSGEEMDQSEDKFRDVEHVVSKDREVSS